MSNQVSMQVQGMGCAACESKVRAAVQEACSSVTEVVVDHAAGTLHYRCPNLDQVPTVVDSIESIGYKVSSVEPA